MGSLQAAVDVSKEEENDVFRPPPPRPRGYSFKDAKKTNSHPDNQMFQDLKPSRVTPGSRTISTSLRLRRQGFRTSVSDFAVKSIRRGSDDWHNLLKPFVSDLVFKSLEYRRHQSDVSFKTYTCQAAVLFVDLCNYSGITRMIAHRGAHVLSNLVNAYFGRLLTIVNGFGGDVVKFAGDAFIVVWEGGDLTLNVRIASLCAMELQKDAESHPVEDTNLSFHIHCGVCCGALESEIFVAPSTNHMQRLYHCVGGESLSEIAELVDSAKQGEICISDECLIRMGNTAVCRDSNDCQILEKLEFNDDLRERIESAILDNTSDRMLRRNRKVEEEFIHPSVIKLLSHGGLSPTQIAQMRNLCVLFIGMTSHGNSVNWLYEVEAILDRNRCPIVQIIDDDKGVHLVAAVNLYESVPETSLKGIDCCVDLCRQEVGCAIGMAQGSTFCGVTGCATVACRWDITGAPVVRAARLMQYAISNCLDVAIDQSVYDTPAAATRLQVFEESVKVKGSSLPISVYTLSQSKVLAAFRVLETVHGRAHNDTVNAILKQIEAAPRTAVVVAGSPLSGKKIVCQRAAGDSNLVPYLHVSDQSGGFLQVAVTIASWWKYAANEDVKYLAESVLRHIEKKRLSRAHDECIDLVNVALEEGLNACFLIDRVQFLDDFSISVIRECLRGRHRSYSRSNSRVSVSSESDTATTAAEVDKGRIVFLCVHVSLYQWRSADAVVKNITRSHRNIKIPVFEVREVSKQEIQILMNDLADMRVEERYVETMREASGNCVGYLIEKAAAIRKSSAELWGQGQRGYMEITTDMEIRASPGCIRKIKEYTVLQVSPDVAMRFSQIFDELPPLFQVFCKILTISARTHFYRLPRTILWEVLNDLVAEGVESGLFGIMLREFQEMFLIKTGHEDDEEVLSFQCPAFGDIAFDVSTPCQIESIAHALIERLQPRLATNFKVPFVIANLQLMIGKDSKMLKNLWRNGYEQFNVQSANWDKKEISFWRETIDDEIIDADVEPTFMVLGPDFDACPVKPHRALDARLQFLKTYMPPISFGPMGHSLSVVQRALFHSHGEYHGYAKETTQVLKNDMKTACARYLGEMGAMEDLLNTNGIKEQSSILESERETILEISSLSSSDKDVDRKARLFLDEYVPKYVARRMKRLHALVHKLRHDKTPISACFSNVDCTLARAYTILRSEKCRDDAGQDALMILATENWKPRPVPEFLPILSYQTVARIRNKVLKRLSASELVIFKHQQSIDDLEAFLLVTPLLYDIQQPTV